MKKLDLKNIEELPHGFFAMTPVSQLVSLWELTSTQVRAVLNLDNHIGSYMKYLPTGGYTDICRWSTRIFKFEESWAERFIRYVEQITLQKITVLRQDSLVKTEIEWMTVSTFTSKYFPTISFMSIQRCLAWLAWKEEWFWVHIVENKKYRYIKTEYLEEMRDVIKALIDKEGTKAKLGELGWKLLDKPNICYMWVRSSRK